MTEQLIEAPTSTDINGIARAIVHATEVVKEAVGADLDGSRRDLLRIQQVLDSGLIDRTATYTLQSLGLVLGKIFVDSHADFDWWMVQDEYGRDPALRYKRTSLLAFPRSMISKRIEDGESVDIIDLFDKLSSRMSELVEQGYADF